MNLQSVTIPVPDVTEGQVAEMLSLMQAHYEGVTDSQFRADLSAKNWVILLYANRRIQGFSTQAFFQHQAEGRLVNVLFSGDTIIDRSHWGSLALPVAWGRLMNSLLASDPERELYWLLTTKGYKTYRFLPVFFREYYPRHGTITPRFERELIKSLSTSLFGGRFDAHTGVLRSSEQAQRLREGIAKIDDKRLRDSHVAFFQQQNPGHPRGDELVCLTRWHPDNLTPYICRQL
jgi:hypothetical protein